MERALEELEDERVNGGGWRKIMEVTSWEHKRKMQSQVQEGKKTSRLKYIRRLTGIHTSTPFDFSGSLCKEAPFLVYSQHDPIRLKVHV